MKLSEDIQFKLGQNCGQVESYLRSLKQFKKSFFLLYLAFTTDKFNWNTNMAISQTWNVLFPKKNRKTKMVFISVFQPIKVQNIVLVYQ